MDLKFYTWLLFAEIGLYLRSLVSLDYESIKFTGHNFSSSINGIKSTDIVSRLHSYFDTAAGCVYGRLYHDCITTVSQQHRDISRLYPNSIAKTSGLYRDCIATVLRIYSDNISTNALENHSTNSQCAVARKYLTN